MRKTVYEDQVVAGFVQQGIQDKETLLVQTIQRIQTAANNAAADADKAFAAACTCVENVRDFINSPSAILGSMRTKHGEIAEHVQVEISNGRRILQSLSPNASLDVGRTAPEDYLIDGRMVQSKFIQSPKGTLDAVIEHSHKYPFFVSKDGYYHIPKDQHEIFAKIANGESVEGLKSGTILTIKNKIEQIEAETGRSFNEVVKPGISNYDDVQLGRIDNTLNNHQEEFSRTNIENHKQIREESAEQTEAANHITDASWGEAFKYGAISAAITGTTSAAINIYGKIKGGKKISEFTLEDWKDVGYDFAKNGTKGGISGLAIYGLTKLGGFSAPFAGAITSSAMGIASLAYDYKQGKISIGEFGDAANALSFEAGLAAIGSALGQAIIPIPVLGAIIGSAVTKAGISVVEKVMGEKEKVLIDNMQKEYDEAIAKLDEQCKKAIAIVEEYYSKLGGLIEAALSPDLNMRFEGSIKLAKFCGEKPIPSIKELNEYMNE